MNVCLFVYMLHTHIYVTKIKEKRICEKMNKNKKKPHNVCDIPLSPDNNKLPKSLQLTQG